MRYLMYFKHYYPILLLIKHRIKKYLHTENNKQNKIYPDWINLYFVYILFFFHITPHILFAKWIIPSILKMSRPQTIKALSQSANLQKYFMTKTSSLFKIIQNSDSRSVDPKSSSSTTYLKLSILKFIAKTHLKNRYEITPFKHLSDFEAGPSQYFTINSLQNNLTSTNCDKTCPESLTPSKLSNAEMKKKSE